LTPADAGQDFPNSALKRLRVFVRLHLSSNSRSGVTMPAKKRPYEKPSTLLAPWKRPVLHKPYRLVKLPGVREKIGFGTTHIYALMKEEVFPKSIAIGPQAVAWIEEEIDLWIEALIAEHDQTLAKEAA
jgi:prophage regulatory protein